MTIQQQQVGLRPRFTIGDRLRKARSLLDGMDVRSFAERLGVSKNTITSYETEATAPERMKPVVLRAWAMATGVDVDWLINGETPEGPAPIGAEPSEWYAPWDSNPEPAVLSSEDGGKRSTFAWLGVAA